MVGDGSGRPMVHDAAHQRPRESPGAREGDTGATRGLLDDSSREGEAEGGFVDSNVAGLVAVPRDRSPRPQ